MPRHPRRISHRGSRPLRAPGGTVEHDPSARLRALVAEGIIAAAALSARDDLEVAAASTHRLGSLTSGMWRALSKELATAAERLDRSTAERLDDIGRRARSLDVDEADVIAAGVAAGHLDSHRETLGTLVPKDEDARLLLGNDMLFGFSIDEPLLDDPDAEDDERLADDQADAEDEDEESLPWTVRVRLFLWPAPLKAAAVSFNPLPIDETSAESAGPPANLTVEASALLIEAVGNAVNWPVERVEKALADLGVACFTAHLMDEVAEDEEADDDDETDDVSDEEDQSLGVDEP
jgi:hypothetical protein